MLSEILPIIQIIVSILLIVAVMMQQQGTGLSGAFGGGGGDGNYHTKRGMEKKLFVSTIILAGLFLISTFVALLI